MNKPECHVRSGVHQIDTRVERIEGACTGFDVDMKGACGQLETSIISKRGIRTSSGKKGHMELRRRVSSVGIKMRALMMRGEEEGGSEIVQTVIVLGFAVGLGAALLLLQGSIQTSITSAGTSITDMFSKVTSGAAK